MTLSRRKEVGVLTASEVISSIGLCLKTFGFEKIIFKKIVNFKYSEILSDIIGYKKNYRMELIK